MPYFKTSAEWFEQSSLLLKARPTTTRISSKYTVLKPTASKIQKRQKYLDKKAARPAKTASTDRATSPQPPSTQQEQSPTDVTTTFVLKTYDPDSGTCLQYETTKGAEVGRLIATLGRLGRCMAALPDKVEDAEAGTETPKVDGEGDVKMGGAATATEQKAGGGKKKKKGKK